LRPPRSARGVETNVNLSASKARNLRERSSQVPLAAQMGVGIERSPTPFPVPLD
jgi:hypothetical protein